MTDNRVTFLDLLPRDLRKVLYDHAWISFPVCTGVCSSMFHLHFSGDRYWIWQSYVCFYCLNKSSTSKLWKYSGEKAFLICKKCREIENVTERLEEGLLIYDP